MHAAVLTAFLSAAPMLAWGATPKPVPLPAPNYPNKRMHVRLIVEVNKRGQVVRVDHGSLSGDRAFDTMALGNAMQMWIRKPNGTAVTGLYSVTYDYNPKSHAVSRVPALVKPGGNWGNKPGAATAIISDARRQIKKLEARLKAEQAKRSAQEAKHLPDINAAVKRSRPKATPHPGARA